jgi:hypothetical protein
MVLPQLGGCPAYQFKPRISYTNNQLPPGTYGIQAPPGLSSASVREATFIDYPTMLSKLQSEPGGHGDRIGIVHGLTVTEFAVKFPNPSQQWRQVRTGAALPSWQFQGGDVLFDITITIYVFDADRPQAGDDRTRQIFAIILEHELLHVLDEIDIVSRWMAPEAYKDDKVLRYLTNAQPVDDAMFRSWFQGDGFSKWLQNGLWAPEHNRRKDIRDTAHEYAALQSRIDDLRADITNHPPP